MPHLTLLLTALLFLAPMAQAQDRSGRDTAGEWVVDHQKAFGLWDSFCDHRTNGDTREARCYLRYVDVYSPHPDFGALFVFVTPDEIEIGTERGTRMADDGLRIERDGAPVWMETRSPCLRGGPCKLTGDARQAFLQAATQGGAMRFTFTDRDGHPRDLTWDLSPFQAALDDFDQNARDRGLF